MDLTLKSKSWAGNIYHQFESICQDVDDFMSKDTVGFVEGQVQSIGISVKKLYSDVVQDILLSPVESEKLESQSANNEKVETWDCVKSDRGIKTDTATVGENQLSENQGPIYSATWTSMPEATDSIPDSEIFLGHSVDDCQISTPLTHEEGLLLTAEREKMASIHGEEKKGFSDDTKCLLNTSSSDLLFKSELTTIKDVNFDEDRSLSDMVAEDLAICGISSKGKSFDDLSTVEKHELAFGDISCDEEQEETGSSSFPCSISPKYSNILESTCECFFEKDENKIESNGSAYNVMSLSSKNADCGTKAVNELPAAILMFESNDSSPLTDGSGFIGGLSEIGMSRPSDTGNIDKFVSGIGDLNMETVQLSPDGKNHDEASVISRGKLGHASMDGKRNFRYYKKLIRDALTSRKRLSKEYQDLAMLYGEIHFEIEPSQHFEPIPITYSPNTSATTVNRQSIHETSDAEWELV